MDFRFCKYGQAIRRDARSIVRNKPLYSRMLRKTLTTVESSPFRYNKLNGIFSINTTDRIMRFFFLYISKRLVSSILNIHAHTRNIYIYIYFYRIGEIIFQTVRSDFNDYIMIIKYRKINITKIILILFVLFFFFFSFRHLHRRVKLLATVQRRRLNNLVERVFCIRITRGFIYIIYITITIIQARRVLRFKIERRSTRIRPRYLRALLVRRRVVSDRCRVQRSHLCTLRTDGVAAGKCFLQPRIIRDRTNLFLSPLHFHVIRSLENQQVLAS